MDELTAELGASAAEQLAAPIDTVEVSEGVGAGGRNMAAASGRLSYKPKKPSLQLVSKGAGAHAQNSLHYSPLCCYACVECVCNPGFPPDGQDSPIQEPIARVIAHARKIAAQSFPLLATASKWMRTPRLALRMHNLFLLTAQRCPLSANVFKCIRHKLSCACAELVSSNCSWLPPFG